jgi:hypothetical protein
MRHPVQTTLGVAAGAVVLIWLVRTMVVCGIWLIALTFVLTRLMLRASWAILQFSWRTTRRSVQAWSSNRRNGSSSYSVFEHPAYPPLSHR